jgi:ketosteroid isomerase-like protein
MIPPTESDPKTIIERMFQAVNRHDLEALLAFFHPDYQSETPCHPSRAFRGRDIVRKNWSSAFKNVPDITVELIRCASDGNTVWAEVHVFGASRQESPFNLRGVVIHSVQADQIVWARYYTEPVDEDTAVT